MRVAPDGDALAADRLRHAFDGVVDRERPPVDAVLAAARERGAGADGAVVFERERGDDARRGELCEPQRSGAPDDLDGDVRDLRVAEAHALRGGVEVPRGPRAVRAASTAREARRRGGPVLNGLLVEVHDAARGEAGGAHHGHDGGRCRHLGGDVRRDREVFAREERRSREVDVAQEHRHLGDVEHLRGRRHRALTDREPVDERDPRTQERRPRSEREPWPPARGRRADGDAGDGHALGHDHHADAVDQQHGHDAPALCGGVPRDAHARVPVCVLCRSIRIVQRK